MNDPLLRVAQEIDPGSQANQRGPLDSSQNNRPPDPYEVDADESEEILVERSDEVSEADELDDAQLFEARLGRIREYAHDALQRDDRTESVIASASAEVMQLQANYMRGLVTGLAADAYTLDAFGEHQTHLKNVLTLTKLSTQLTQLELNLRRAPQRDPLRSHRPPSRPR